MFKIKFTKIDIKYTSLLERFLIQMLKATDIKLRRKLVRSMCPMMVSISICPMWETAATERVKQRGVVFQYIKMIKVN